MYELTQFGGVTLPRYNASEPLRTGDARPAIATGPGGSTDAYGSDAWPVVWPQDLQLHASFVERNNWQILTAINALTAAVGTRAKLYRRLFASDEVQWCHARLIGVTPAFSHRNIAHQDMDLTFQQWSPWYGLYWGPVGDLTSEQIIAGVTATGTAATALDASPKSLVLYNNGNRPIESMIVTVTAAGTAITALTLAISGVATLAYSGSIAAGQALVIDTGAMTVKNNGTADYANLARSTGHAIDGWLRLAASVPTTLTVTKTGGSTASTAAVTYSETWL